MCTPTQLPSVLCVICSSETDYKTEACIATPYIFKLNHHYTSSNITKMCLGHTSSSIVYNLVERQRHDHPSCSSSSVSKYPLYFSTFITQFNSQNLRDLTYNNYHSRSNIITHVPSFASSLLLFTHPVSMQTIVLIWLYEWFCMRSCLMSCKIISDRINKTNKMPVSHTCLFLQFHHHFNTFPTNC